MKFKASFLTRCQLAVAVVFCDKIKVNGAANINKKFSAHLKFIYNDFGRLEEISLKILIKKIFFVESFDKIRLKMYNKN